MPNTPRMFPAQPPPPGWGQQGAPQPPQQSWQQNLQQRLPPGWPPPGGLRKSRGKLIMFVILAAVGVALVLTVPGYCNHRARVKYKAELQVRADMVKRWKAILNAGTCYRRDDGVRWFKAIEQTIAGKGDLLHDLTSHMPLVDKQCVAMLRSLETDPDLPDAVHAVVKQWLDAEKPLGKLNDGPPEEAKALLEARDQIRERVRTEVLPAVRDRIRKVQEMNAVKKNYIWWRLELGMQLENLFDLAYATHRTGKDFLPVIQVPLNAMVEQMYKADREVGVHVMPSLTVLGHSAGTDSWGNLLNIEDNGAWDNLQDDNTVFGPMPPEPEGCDINIFDNGSSSTLR